MNERPSEQDGLFFGHDSAQPRSKFFYLYIMLGINGLKTLLGLELRPGAPTLLIYSEQFSTRLQYASDFIFNHVLKVNFELTHDKTFFENSNHSKINYSTGEIPRSLQIIPKTFLFETGISTSQPKPVLKNNMIYFYENEDGFHIDIFAAVFYFISRYEEWQNVTHDVHLRFEASESILQQHAYLQKPVVDIWINELKAALELMNPELKFPEPKWRVISTIDVDNVYAFKGKGWFRALGASCRDLLNRDFKNLSNRLEVLVRGKKDPFDVYEEVTEFCFENQIPLIFFFLYRTGTAFDRTLEPGSEGFREVFETLKQNKSLIGIHPSYHSSDNPALLTKEIKQLSADSAIEIQFSRQHYLRMKIAETPEELMENGILADFTMGFASAPGFRAGTSHPFHYFDLKRNLARPLLMVPFCAMDGAYTIYGKVDEKEALASLLNIAEEVKNTGGNFISVFHERSFYDHLYPRFGTLYKNLHLQLKG